MNWRTALVTGCASLQRTLDHAPCQLRLGGKPGLFWNRCSAATLTTLPARNCQADPEQRLHPNEPGPIDAMRDKDKEPLPPSTRKVASHSSAHSGSTILEGKRDYAPLLQCAQTNRYAIMRPHQLTLPSQSSLLQRKHRRTNAKSLVRLSLSTTVVLEGHVLTFPPARMAYSTCGSSTIWRVP